MKIRNWFRTPSHLIVAAVMMLSTLLPFLNFGIAHAYGLVSSRSITISSASNAASNATTTYTVSFNAATSGTVQGMIVDFCSNDPIIGDPCTQPTGFVVSSSIGTVTTTGQSGLTWSAASANSGRTLQLTTTGTVSGSVASGANINFTINNVQNPTSAASTFYARIFTFASSGNVASWESDTTDGITAGGGASTLNVVDAGGVALSTNQSIAVTAKVQEQLSFCVGTTTLPSQNAAATAQTLCSNLSGSSVALGNDKGVLSSAGPFVDVSTQYIVGTNAANGAVIVMKGDTLKSGGGSNSINAIGSTATASAAGTSQFGVCTYEGTGSNLVFTNETNNSYNDANCNTATQTATYGSTGGNGTAKFGFNTTNTLSASGDILAKENAGSNSTGILPIIGNIATTQVAGIYTTSLSFIATGTF